MDPHLSLFALTTLVLLGTLQLHLALHSELEGAKTQVLNALDEDLRRWSHIQETDLMEIRGDYDMAAELMGDLAASKGILRSTIDVLHTARGEVDILVNRTKEFYGWMRNHLLLSHEVTRGVSAPQLVKLCLPISITTRKSKWKHLNDMLLVTSFLPSLMKTLEPGYFYGVYLGYDEGDPLLDHPEAKAEMQAIMEKWVGGAPVELKMFCYNDSQNRNVWAVNYITRECYLDGYDYFFRINDDSSFFTPSWASRLVPRLQELNNFGVVGTLDTGNPRIFTHSLVGRPHIEVFGYYFPFEFGNYWSDDWITAVYEPPYVIKAYDVELKHARHAERYKVEWQRQNVLDEMVVLGRKRWKSYLCLVRHHTKYCKKYAALFKDQWLSLRFSNANTTIAIA